MTMLLAIIVFTTAVVTMIAAIINLLSKWTEMKIAKSKASTPEATTAATDKASGDGRRILRYLWKHQKGDLLLLMSCFLASYSWFVLKGPSLGLILFAVYTTPLIYGVAFMAIWSAVRAILREDEEKRQISN